MKKILLLLTSLLVLVGCSSTNSQEAEIRKSVSELTKKIVTEHPEYGTLEITEIYILDNRACVGLKSSKQPSTPISMQLAKFELPSEIKSKTSVQASWMQISVKNENLSDCKYRLSVMKQFSK